MHAAERVSLADVGHIAPLGMECGSGCLFGGIGKELHRGVRQPQSGPSARLVGESEHRRKAGGSRGGIARRGRGRSTEDDAKHRDDDGRHDGVPASVRPRIIVLDVSCDKLRLETHRCGG